MAFEFFELFSPWTQAIPGPFRGGVVTLGNFDGVHLGHRDLLKRARALAGSSKKLVVATLDPHPRLLLRPQDTGPPLLTLERKAEKLRQAGADLVIVFRIQPEFLQIPAETFFKEIIVGALGATHLVEGTNFCFGKSREGTIQKLGEFCARDQIGLDLHSGVFEGDDWVSTSRIREKIEKGEVVAAEAMLGSPVEISGKVIQGAQRGRTIGVPTANLEVVGQLTPGLGVYSARAVLSDERKYPVAVNIGPNPTFAENQFKIEAHLIGFSGDLYGQNLRLEFLDRVRDLCAFSSVDALKNQLSRDIAHALKRNQTRDGTGDSLSHSQAVSGAQT